MKRLLLILCAMLMGMSSLWAYDFSAVNSDGKTIYYNITDSINHEVEVAKYPDENSKYSGVINIPSSVVNNGITYSVTGIHGGYFYGDGAFAKCGALTSVTIPNTVTTIGIFAFWCCSGLTSLTIPNTVTAIGASAFENCNGLTSVTIPNSVTTIGASAFENCSGLASVTISNTVTTIGVYAFRGCSGLTSITIPNSVTKIDNGVFQNCSGLTSIMIPNTVTTIGEGSFLGCRGLRLITIPNSVLTIEDYAFASCMGLMSITIPNSVTTIGNEVFSFCRGLTSVTVDAITPPTLGQDVFDRVSSNIPIYVPTSSVNAYRNDEGWQYFMNIKPKEWRFSVVNNDGKTIYYSVSDLINHQVDVVAFPDTNQYRGDINIPSFVTNDGISYIVSGISVGSFANCGDLISITISDSVKTIGERAFMDCSSLTSVVIPNLVTTIGGYAFANDSNLHNIYWNAKNVITYGDISSWGVYLHPFKDASIGTVIFGDSVQVIPSKVFCDIMSMTNVTVGSNVISIGDSAFVNCTRIASIEVKNQIPPLMTNTTFKNVRQGIPVYVPCGSLESYQADNYWSYFTNFQCGTSMYEITTMSNNEEWGTVTGGGEYEEGTTTTLTATANEGYYFVSWNDGDTENPRTITVTENATYIATFNANSSEEIEDVEDFAGVRVYPNPSSGMIFVEGDDLERIEVMNRMGEKVMEVEDCSKVDLSRMERGVYVLRITMGEGTAVRRVVKR